MALSQTRAVIVTGAARGIGYAVAVRLLNDGWRVAAADIAARDLSRAFAAIPNPAEQVIADVRDESQVERMVTTTLERFGRLDAVVSNAGIMRRKPIRSLTLAEWREVIDTNLTATFLLARASERALRDSKGAIVAIASTRATMSEPDTESYSASKGGLVALTHALAVSLGPDVRVNCISPGWIETGDEATLRAEDHAQHPAGRVGRPEDVAELVAYLVDNNRSGFVTGADFVIDGGMTRKMIYVE